MEGGEAENKGNKGGGRVAKTPKGTRDYGPEETRVREEVLETIKGVFRQHGAVSIETPVFELKEVLLGSYGDDEKLIFDLAEQGGEFCALRYDLTVPFSRYVAQNNVKQIKKYQIGRVYRRDQPRMDSGRYREFYQCDFDVAGSEFGRMVPDAECVAIMAQILGALKVGSFQIKLNHRKLLDGIFTVCGVPADLFVPICSAVDKLDKLPWADVRAEMTMKKLPEAVADKIGDFVVKIKGPAAEVLRLLREDKALCGHEGAATAMQDLEILFGYLQALGCDNVCTLDLSLARGLSYYTGVIFEAVLTDSSVHVGSVGGGGRYDELVGRFKKKNQQVPCVGFSIGVERLFTVMQKIRQDAKKLSSTDVMVCSIEAGALEDRMRLAAELWKAGIAAEFLLKEKPKIQTQLKHAETNNIPLAVIFGPEELANGRVKVKDLATGEQVEVSRGDMAAMIKEKIEEKRKVV